VVAKKQGSCFLSIQKTIFNLFFISKHIENTMGTLQFMALKNAKKTPQNPKPKIFLSLFF
jgi:hypothetical protein